MIRTHEVHLREKPIKDVNWRKQLTNKIDKDNFNNEFYDNNILKWVATNR